MRPACRRRPLRLALFVLATTLMTAGRVVVSQIPATRE